MTDDDDIDSSGTEPTVARDPVIGSEVSGYRVTNRLGSGGMGIVYEGEQPLIGKRVAIKVLRHEVADNPEVVERLVSEARAVNKVGHRGIIDVFGFGKLPDGRHCIVMEYLDGEPLEAVMGSFEKQGGRLPLADALVILEEVLSALSAAHHAGVIHRDLKPSNIFLCKQRDGSQYVKLLDFGIAKLGVLATTPATRASIMVGTPAYMAPEQANGGVVGPTMDLYALGVLAFELFTGRQPFSADSVVEMLMKHANEPPPKVSSVNPSVPAELDALVDQLLAKDPSKRPESADVVRQRVLALRKKVNEPVKVAVKVEPPPPDLAITQPAPPAAFLATAVVDRSKQPVNTPEQRAPTAPQLSPVVTTGPLPTLPRSKGPFIALAVVAVGLVVGAALLLGPHESAPPEPPPAVPEPPPAAGKAPHVDTAPAPAETAKAEPTPAPAEAAKAEPPPAPAETAKAEPPPAPAETAKTEPAPAPTETTKPAPPERSTPDTAPPTKPAPVPTASSAPKRAPTPPASLDARVSRLDKQLKAAEQAGENVSVLRKTLTVIQNKLAQPALTPEAREQLEVTLSRLEAELKELN
jgi:serine/threonine-protein kinase